MTFAEPKSPETGGIDSTNAYLALVYDSLQNSFSNTLVELTLRFKNMCLVFPGFSVLTMKKALEDLLRFRRKNGKKF
jgi:hypothetical protein